MKNFVAKDAIKKIKIKTMHKITNKETGFQQYMSDSEAANFMYHNGTDKYKIEEIKGYDFGNFFAFIVFLILMSTFTIGVMYFSTL
tara:strand:- start:209 stop:466 length:258 start_codon:yes stop_codon:yes gene_type:complete